MSAGDDSGPGALAIEPLAAPPDVTVTVPGSKSLTNRALVCAALARGRSAIGGALAADDTAAMIGALRTLGVEVVESASGLEVASTGRPVGSPDPVHPAVLDARLSGTTARFVLPLSCLAEGTSIVDGDEPLRRRPIGPLADALRTLGGRIEERGEPGHLPLAVEGGLLAGGEVAVAGDVSSQFVTALLLAGPAMASGLRVRLTSDLVARPFVELTLEVMAAFGASARSLDDGFEVEPGGYRPTRYDVEPDATAASYFFAAAAMTRGRVAVDGLGTATTQGDLDFVDVLARMGAEVTKAPHRTEVRGGGRLHGVDVDLSATPDVAQTLAVVAAVAEGPTTVRGVSVVRGHETDRIAAVVAELRRCGVGAEERPDGFVVEPAPLRPAEVRTYDDHRMAMSFALLGLVAPGISIADPGCVSKTFPTYFEALEQLRSAPGARSQGS